MAGLTKLEAVNQLLESINTPITDTLETGQPSIAGEAERHLDSMRRLVCALGLPESLNRAVQFTPDGSGFVTLDSNVLRIIPVAASQGRRFIIRGSKVYDAARNTFNLGTDTVFLDCAIHLDWDDCPPLLREKIAAEAAVRFQRRRRNSDQHDEFLTQEAGFIDAIQPRDEMLRSAMPPSVTMPTTLPITNASEAPGG